MDREQGWEVGFKACKVRNCPAVLVRDGENGPEYAVIGAVVGEGEVEVPADVLLGYVSKLGPEDGMPPELAPLVNETRGDVSAAVRVVGMEVVASSVEPLIGPNEAAVQLQG